MVLFLLNIFEIIAINGVPFFIKFFTSRFSRFDVKYSIGVSIVVLILIASLTHKPHNIFLVAILCSTSQMINQSITKVLPPKYVNCGRLISHFWLGREFFFYQGNSNSLASIDLNAGFIGLKSFNFPIVAFLLTANTFCGPILSALLCIYHSYDDGMSRKNKTNPISNATRSWPLLFELPFAIYTLDALAFRNHIFVWTVFSPKLLYEFYSVCLMCFLWILFRCIPVL